MVWVPLVLLAIPSVVIGYLTVGPMLFGDFFDGVIHVAAIHDSLGEVGKNFHGAWAFMIHGFATLPFWLAMAGLGSAFFVYMLRPSIAQNLRIRFDWLYLLLDKKYGFDEFNQLVFAGGSKLIGKVLWVVGDRTLIDGVVVNGSAQSVGRFAAVARVLQSGYLYHYAIVMILGLLGLLFWFVIR